jgi:hypothetical protein
LANVLPALQDILSLKAQVDRLYAKKNVNHLAQNVLAAFVLLVKQDLLSQMEDAVLTFLVTHTVVSVQLVLKGLVVALALLVLPIVPVAQMESVYNA